MTEREALKLALEALEEPKEHVAKHRRLEAITAIKEVLAEQEHVSYSGNGTAGREADVRPTPFFFQMPPQREWVGLTDEEVFKALNGVDISTARVPPGFKLFAQAIEAKLREKNGG